MRLRTIARSVAVTSMLAPLAGCQGPANGEGPLDLSGYRIL